MASLDSSYVIDLLSGLKSARDLAVKLEASGEVAFITSPAASEVLVGAYRYGGRSLQAAQTLLGRLPLLPFDRESYDLAGKLGAELLDRGTPIGQSDLYIGAISLRHGQPLVTRDTAFLRIPGLRTQGY